MGVNMPAKTVVFTSVGGGRGCMGTYVVVVDSKMGWY